MMKRIIGLVLVFVLVFAVAANAFAASKPKITKQPESATVKKGGKVSFSIKTSGTVNTIIWYFVDPATGNSYTGKKLSSAVKGVKVEGPTNGKKITLKNVPESMHGWTVYAHVNGNGYKIDSDKVLLLISGMETPADTSVSAEPPVEEAPPAEAPPAEEAPAEEAPAEEVPSAEATPADQAAEPAPEQVPEEEIPAGPFTVSATSKSLIRLDASGSVMDETPFSSLEFTGNGYVLVTSDEPIISWTLNGVRIQPDQPVKEFRVMNVTADLSIDITTARVSAADAVVDESRMCKVVCKGCTFSYARGKLRSVTEGEVPAGAPINIVADSSDLAQKGYQINGADPENQGKAGFQLVVNEDVEIVCE